MHEVQNCELRKKFKKVIKMRRNKRVLQKKLKLNFYVKTIGVTVIVVSLGILYVWQNIQSVRIGYRIKQKEQIVKELQKKLHGLEVTVARLKMPQTIKRSLEENNISLSVPQSWQIVKISEVPLYFDDCFSISSQEIIYDENQIGKTLIAIPSQKNT